MKFPKSYLILLAAAFLFWISNAGAQNTSLGIFSNSADVGDSTKTGNATYIPFNNLYVVSGSGYNVWFDRDEFHYLYKKMKGDFRVSARVEFIGRGTDPHRKMGWMVVNQRCSQPSGYRIRERNYT